ncbi:MAG: universal stress protein, partial [Phycisphaerae bacterium]|nr:universal stress protein [Phycisphaerae bacterium]
MKRFKRLGVYLDEWPDDEDVLAFTDRIAKLADSESIACVYWARHDSGTEQARDHEAFVREHLSPEVMARTKIEVAKHHALEAVLKIAHTQQLDLVLAGRSLPSEQVAVGNVFNRLARKSPCTVLLVPKDAHVHMARILVPVDFSDHSKLALEAALDFARESHEHGPQVVAQTVFAVDYGYSKTGVSLEEAQQRLAEVNRKRLEEFVQDMDKSGVAFEIVCTCSEQPDAAVRELASARKMDLICLGSRGITSDT